MTNVRRIALVVVVALLMSATATAFVLPIPTARASANDTISSFSLSGSPFAQDFAPLPTAVTIRLTLARWARVSVTIYDSADVPVRHLAINVRRRVGARSWTWSGRDDAATFVPDATYRVELSTTNLLGTATVERSVRKGMPAIYPQNPAAIVIVVDPGHGGRYPGSAYNGVPEKTVNLATALYLRDLLERAGITVVMTRTTDTAVDEPISDVNGDGIANSYDDIIIRNDIANEARGDLNIHVHNNSAFCKCQRGSSVYTNVLRTWTPEAMTLAGNLHDEQLAVLDQFSDGTYYPIDRGIRKGSYDYMRPYSVACPTAMWRQSCQPTFLPRPTLMPSVLMESLFMNNDIEFALLMRDDVRIALAASMYLGIADWLNSRDYGAGFEAIGVEPSTGTAGATTTYHVRVTNRGNVASSGWTLRLGAVPAVAHYDGSGAAGDFLGSAAVPDGLAPGASVDLDVPAVLPGAAGDWLVKTDIRLADDSSFADMGIVPLQLNLTTTAP